MKIFKINNVEVSAEEIKKLIKENPELLKEISGKPWRGDRGETYSFVGYDGMVGRADEMTDTLDDHLYLTGNYFKTQAEAEQYVEYQKAVGRITHAILERNEGWKPDWSDKETVKYYVCFCNSINEWEVSYLCSDQCLEIFPYMKSEEIAHSIIKDFKDDLEIIRNWAGR